MTEMETLQPPKPRRWLRLAAFLLIPVAAALTLAAVLPRTAKAVPQAAAGDHPAGQGAGCTHAADAQGAQSCPHGMDANGGCNMNAAPGDAHGQSALPNAGHKLDWTLPKEWIREANQGGMRYATLRPVGEAKVDVSIIPLAGAAGGELANVNRWRSQIGLDPVSEKELAALRTQLNSQAGPVAMFDLSNPRNPAGRMLVGMLATRTGVTWFVKMVGEHDPVAKARPAFLKLLESLRENS